mgnify:CR=1 FL=1
MIEAVAAQRAARLIGEARKKKRTVSTFPTHCEPHNEADGYAIQSALNGWLAQTGSGSLVGYKVGCTTPVMQDIVGVSNPAYGSIMTTGTNLGRAEFAADDFQNPGIECEVAVRISTDTEAGCADYDRSRIARHIGACMAAIEIVDNRYGDFTTAGAPLMIADNFFHAACVLGPEFEEWKDLDLAALEIPPIFRVLKAVGDLDNEDMLRTFNMGAGMALVVAPEAMDEIVAHLAAKDCRAYWIGEIVPGKKKVEFEGTLTW